LLDDNGRVEMKYANDGSQTPIPASGNQQPSVVQKSQLTHSAPRRCAQAVESVTVTNFRNYERMRLQPGPQSVVLFGANGVGKTNLLEAVSFLVPGRGLRRVRLSDITRQGQGRAMGWGVAAKVVNGNDCYEIGTGIVPSLVSGVREKRQVRIDGEDKKSQADLAPCLSAQWLTPGMDRIFVEGRSARRRFIDRMIFGWDAAHAGRVTAFEHALRERAKLLENKTLRDDAWLSTIEARMAEKAVAVAAARVELVSRLDEACGSETGAFPKARIALDGLLERWLMDGPALLAEDRYRDSLAQTRGRDRDTGRTEHGPHRTDLKVHHVLKNQSAELCSTGEQKALLIALVLANARLHSNTHGRQPILLLDEIGAHLDEVRRQTLFDELYASGVQVWMTGTDRRVFDPLVGRAQFYKIEDGQTIPDN